MSLYSANKNVNIVKILNTKFFVPISAALRSNVSAGRVGVVLVGRGTGAGGGGGGGKGRKMKVSEDIISYKCRPMYRIPISRFQSNIT